MAITCIIVEDEPLALERTRGYAEQIPALSLLAVFDNGADALVYLSTHPVDLIFLDIHLGDMSGIRLLETADLHSEVILTTAYDQYALKGYELRVADYLLKPFTFERFFAAVNHVGARLEKSRRPAIGGRRFLFVKTEHRLEKVLLGELLYIEGARDYRRIYTRTKKIMTLQSFRDFEQDVPEQQLCRVHKSYMVAPDKIDAVEKDGIRIGAVMIPISETYRKRFFEIIQGAGN